MMYSSSFCSDNNGSWWGASQGTAHGPGSPSEINRPVSFEDCEKRCNLYQEKQMNSAGGYNGRKTGVRSCSGCLSDDQLLEGFVPYMTYKVKSKNCRCDFSCKSRSNYGSSTPSNGDVWKKNWYIGNPGSYCDPGFSLVTDDAECRAGGAAVGATVESGYDSEALWSQPAFYPGQGCQSMKNDVELGALDLNTCKQRCISDASCKSIDWYNDGSVCRLSYSTASSVGEITSTAKCEYWEKATSGAAASSDYV